MIVLHFSCIDPQSKYQECMYGTQIQDIESGFEAINTLVSEGWQMLQIQCRYTANGTNRWVHLPLEAFDGHPIKKPIEHLQSEWESILYSNSSQP